MGNDALRFLQRHFFARGLLMGLFLAGLFFGAGPGLLPGLLLLFLPGYLVLRLLSRANPLEQALAAFPLSIAVLGLALYVLSLAGVPVVNPLVAIGLTALLAALAFLRRPPAQPAAQPVAEKKPKRTKKAAEAAPRSSFPVPTSQFLMLAVILLAFAVASVYLGKLDFGSKDPLTVTSVDSSAHLAEMEWMIESGTYTMDPSFINHLPGFEPVNFTPVSILVPTAFTQLTGLKVWGGMILFVALVFALSVGGVMLLTRKLFGVPASLLAGVMLALIPKDFFAPYRLGMYRVDLAILFVPFLLYYLTLLSERRRVGLLFGLLAGGLALIHPANALLLVLPLFLLSVDALASKEKATLFELAQAVLPSLIGLLFYLPAALAGAKYAPATFIAGGTPFGLRLLPIEAVEKIGAQSNTIYTLAKIPLPYLWIPLAVFACLVFRFLRQGQGFRPFGWRKLLHRPRFVYSTVFCLLLLLTFVGFTDNSRAIEYLMKFRFTLMAVFLLPLTAYACTFPARLSFLKGDRLLQRLAPVACAGVLMAAFALPNTLQPHNIQETLNQANYAPIQWIKENTPRDATVLFMHGYIQYANHFSHRVSTYVSPQRFDNILMGRSVEFTHESPVCDDLGGAVKRTGLFSFELPACANLPQHVCDYDYLVMKLSENEPLRSLTQAFMDWLNPYYSVAYQKNDYFVLKKARDGCQKKDPRF